MQRNVSPLVCGAMILALSSTPASLAQSGDEALKQEIEALKQGQQEIRKQLEEIKKLVQQRPSARPSGPNVQGKVIDLGENLVEGAATAKLTLVEFTDYQ